LSRAAAKLSTLGAGGGQCGFLRLSTLQAGELLVFQALDLGRGKADFVLDGLAWAVVVTVSSWARKRAAFWRWTPASRSRRVRSVPRG
jgi:hypothetical protein